MTTSRREFMRSAGMIGAGLTVASSGLAASKNSSKFKKAAAPLKMLILGGTGFVGPNMVKYAVERGHEVAIFTRGRRESETPGVEHLVGDRNDNLKALEGRKWDVVFDNNTYDYKWVQRSTSLLKDAVDQYVFISSIAAYDFEPYGYQFKDRVLKELMVGTDYKTRTPPDGWKDGDDADYGLTKSISEKIIHKAFPGQATIVRPGIIVGPGDPTNRWSYVLERIAEGGEIMGPGNPEHSYQVIDQRDVTEWIVRLAENKTMGNYNTVGPAGTMSMQRMYHAIWGAVGSKCKFTWVPESFLEEQDIEVYRDVPGWVPGHYLRAVDNESAIEAGLTFRPMAISAIEHLEWERARSKEGDKDRRSRQHGISREREREILTAWKKREG